MACTHPYIYKGRLVPCGHCASCRKKRVNDWMVRLVCESKYYKGRSLYITFTYNDNNLPPDQLLCKRDMQLFIKRLRIAVVRRFPIYANQLRYFYSGEYGDKFGRPHYHMILFGLPFTPEVRQLIEECWAKGFICFGCFSPQSARYVAKYCVKQFVKTRNFTLIDDKTGEIIDKCQAEFVNMSRRVGLGYKYLSDNFLELACSNVVNIGRYSYSIPKSFKDKLRKMGVRSQSPINIIYNEKIYGDGANFDVKTLNLDFAHSVLGSPADATFFSGDLKTRSYFIKEPIFMREFMQTGEFIPGRVNYISFKDYLSNMRGEVQREKTWCQLHKIDFKNFYLTKFDYKFPVCLEQKFYEYTGSRTSEDFVECLKSVMYEKFGYLYY